METKKFILENKECDPDISRIELEIKESNNEIIITFSAYDSCGDYTWPYRRWFESENQITNHECNYDEVNNYDINGNRVINERELERVLSFIDYVDTEYSFDVKEILGIKYFLSSFEKNTKTEKSGTKR